MIVLKKQLPFSSSDEKKVIKGNAKDKLLYLDEYQQLFTPLPSLTVKCHKFKNLL